MGKTGRTFNAMRNTILGKREILKEVKTEVLNKMMRPTILYDRNMNSINAVEMRILRKIEAFCFIIERSGSQII